MTDYEYVYEASSDQPLYRILRSDPMTNICHGKGDPENDGCCWVAGRVCPLRWKNVEGRIYDHAGTDIGTVAQAVKLLPFEDAAAQARAADQIRGTRITCRAALEVIAEDPTLLDDRERLNEEWDVHPEYLDLVRPEWEAIEAQLSLPEGSYQCSTWMGTGRAQCCFAEDPVTNAERAASLPEAAKRVRRNAELMPPAALTPPEPEETS